MFCLYTLLTWRLKLNNYRMRNIKFISARTKYTFGCFFDWIQFRMLQRNKSTSNWNPSWWYFYDIRKYPRILDLVIDLLYAAYNMHDISTVGHFGPARMVRVRVVWTCKANWTNGQIKIEVCPRFVEIFKLTFRVHWLGPMRWVQ